ncbi:hypothetical protein [Capnocytophaga sp. oral taxon 863]|uniref:hypothetical protein n=1 Tax=Capnocytophaga sp. oral taxon 863 TaxID=1227265 RepID=UPI0003FEE807|nr:hypothetical protein [Capnocytophaga sp. oral taxon 863]
MKKILLSAVAVLAFSFANAQELVSSKGENYLPKQGDWSIGFNANSALKFVGNAFNGANGNEVNFNSNDATKLPGFANSVSFVGKNFTSDTTADRYTANLLFSYKKSKSDNDAETAFGLLAGYGKEWRKGTTRLQGFYGADALIGFSSPAKNDTNFLLGAQGFAGVEYFIFPKVALGAQYAFPVTISYEKSGENNTFKFGIGNSPANGATEKTGFGTASVLLNLYF